jgi:hypothetical protein
MKQIKMKNILMKLHQIFCLCAVRCSCFFSFHDWEYKGSKDSKVFKGSTWYKYECKHCNIERDNFSW